MKKQKGELGKQLRDRKGQPPNYCYVLMKVGYPRTQERKGGGKIAQGITSSFCANQLL